MRPVAALALAVAALLIMTGCHTAGTGLRNSGYGSYDLPHFVMPVRGIQPSELTANFGTARDGGARKHEGLDIMAPMGREVIACVSGTIESKKWNALGGNAIWLHGDDGKYYYFAHLSAYADGIEEGRRVHAADVIGFVGNTGDAQGKSPHLHFEIHEKRGGPAFDPYPVLRQEGILVMAIDPPAPKKKH